MGSPGIVYRGVKPGSRHGSEGFKGCCPTTTEAGRKLLFTTRHTGSDPQSSSFAARLRAAGHVVHTPDLYNGEVFSDRNDAIRKIQELGFDRLLERAVAAVDRLPHDLLYAGFSNGGACAELLAATRPGARGAILIHAPLMVRALVWPLNVPVRYTLPIRTR